jgi:hypothetical protein
MYIRVCPVLGLKILSHKIFWSHLGLYVNRFWFLNFNNVFSILDHYLKF